MCRRTKVKKVINHLIFYNIMKKFLVILASVIVAAFTLSMTTSCKKDVDLAKSLVGTSWYASEGTDSYKLIFDTDKKCTMNVFDKLGGQKQYGGAFVLTGAKNSLVGENITVTLENRWDDIDVLTGEFTSETTLRLNNIVYTKGLLE